MYIKTYIEREILTTIALACPELKIGAAGFCMQHAEADLKATSMSAALIDRSMYVMYVYIYIYIYIDRSVYVIERDSNSNYTICNQY